MPQKPQIAIVLIRGSDALLAEHRRQNTSSMRQNTLKIAPFKSLGASYGSPQEEDL